jgi:hypothetical protein
MSLLKTPYPMPRPTMPQDNMGMLSDADAQRIIQQTQGGSPNIMSRVGSGLLGGASRVGSGLLGAGRDIGRAVAPVAPQALMNIADTMRFYQAAQMQQPSLVTADDLDKLRPINPAGIAAMLPQLRAEEQAAVQKPMLDMLGAQAAARRASGSQSAQKTSPKTYLLPDGQTVAETYFDKISGQRLISGTNEPLPTGSLEFADGDVPKFENLSTFNKEVTEEEQKLIALDKYKNALQNAPEGFGRSLQAMNMILQTLSSDPNFKMGDLATGEARARLQGLIGTYKEDIVGGGVMTEQDALRVIEALGGEVSAFNPSELQIKLIDSFRENSERKYLSALKRYNKAYDTTLPTMAGKRIFDKRDAYVNPFDVKNNPDDIDALLNKPEYQ